MAKCCTRKCESKRDRSVIQAHIEVARLLIAILEDVCM